MSAPPPPAPFSGVGNSCLIDETLARLSAGAAAPDLLKDVVKYVTDNKPCIPLMMADFIVYLADQGASVATDDPDCALENLMSKQYNARPALYPAVCTRLLGRPGELPLHILARHGALYLSQKDLSAPDVQISLHARDSRGRTLSHWLWAEPSELAKGLALAKQQAGGMFAADTVRVWHSAIANTWINQQYLQDLGVGMEIPDHNGVTALELCTARIADGSALLAPEFAVCRMVEAYCDRNAMQEQTTSLSAPIPGCVGPRL